MQDGQLKPEGDDVQSMNKLTWVNNFARKSGPKTNLKKKPSTGVVSNLVNPATFKWPHEKKIWSRRNFTKENHVDREYLSDPRNKYYDDILEIKGKKSENKTEKWSFRMRRNTTSLYDFISMSNTNLPETTNVFQQNNDQIYNQYKYETKIPDLMPIKDNLRVNNDEYVDDELIYRKNINNF